MSYTLLDGKALSATIRAELKRTVAALPSPPRLVVFLSHPHHSSTIYVRNKLIACKEVGIATTLIDTPCTTTEELLRLIRPHAHRADVNGLLVQFPLHPDVDQRHIIEAIPPEKDVDGAHPLNMGKLAMQDPSGFIPCTPLGIQTLLSAHHIPTRGKHVVIIGRSLTVGKPLALLLSQTGPHADATVTLANRSTPDLVSLCRTADIIVAAAGRARLITADMVREGAVVIDVGINRIEIEGKERLVGDVDFATVSPHCSAITPVPGGVGPMTIASLLSNIVKSYKARS